uniref:Uncharacterized protein n=1 Tax=Craspedostauros australis TaxID=1486917 RepID=A0A7R9WND3_9STRA|mmetsp:Transcript_13192/g.36430  ORF Transcript_13192/g.36430 Transcript_13192/m.36430 type:complete len:218 (+) Transcript_13192:174-827(+)|eukprot:CAMPEP_0198132282 /NCGR_PEP_ID=MMETSP1442-20131203/57984_1 /TAXON_ID= /ORGANISM="Craspedostauros australis, Strain CCMP3328" /LENGTH=217 /DNA_ID=CAMNT_0043793253 /DNA_START=140 /DNA_END=793 /DNA_ORIENTATION=+
MKIYQLYSLTICLMASLVAAQEGGAPDCAAACEAKVGEAWSSANGEIEGLKNEINALRGQLEEAQRARDDLHNSREEVQRNLNGVTEEKDNLVRARDDAQRALEAANNDKAAVEQQLGELGGQLEAAKSAATGAQAKAANLENEISSKAAAFDKELASKTAALAAEKANAKAAQDEAAAADAQAKKFTETRLLINTPLIQKDVKDFLKKLGIGSKEL